MVGVHGRRRRGRGGGARVGTRCGSGLLPFRAGRRDRRGHDGTGNHRRLGCHRRCRRRRHLRHQPAEFLGEALRPVAERIALLCVPDVARTGLRGRQQLACFFRVALGDELFGTLQGRCGVDPGLGGLRLLTEHDLLDAPQRVAGLGAVGHRGRAADGDGDERCCTCERTEQPELPLRSRAQRGDLRGRSERFPRPQFAMDGGDHFVEVGAGGHRFGEDLCTPVGEQRGEFVLFGVLRLDEPVTGDRIDQRVVTTHGGEVHGSFVVGKLVVEAVARETPPTHSAHLLS